MGSLVLELQRDSLDSSVAISGLLRKALVVAHKLQIREFEEWVTRELDGYQNAAEVPQYRQIQGSVRVWNPFHGWQPVLHENPNVIFQKHSPTGFSEPIPHPRGRVG